MNYISPSQWAASTDLYNNQLLVGGQPYWVMDAQQPWSLTNPGGDNTTLRFEVREGDVWQQGDAAITPMKNRSEIAGTTHYADGTNIHIAYDWTVEPGAANTASWMTVGQLRQAANDEYSAPFGIMMNGERMRISAEEGGTDASWSNYHDVYMDSQDIVRGHQYHMQIDARFDAVNGHLDVIRDGVTLVNYDGPLGWANMGSVYWKEGVYRADAPEAMAMDYSHLSITTGDAATTSTSTTSIPTSSTTTTTTTVSAPAQSPGVTVSGSDPTVYMGSANADTITGPDGQHNALYAGAGNDSIVGGSGFNQVNGNQGDDTIVGHSAVGDWLFGGQGNDLIDASASNVGNIINGNRGADTLVGGSGADTLYGGQGDDVIHAGSGDDWISGDLGNNTIYGGQGADTFHASAGHDVVTGWHAGDHVQVDSGVAYTTAQVNSDVHINFSNGGEIDLLNTQLSSLQSGWIYQA